MMPCPSGPWHGTQRVVKISLAEAIIFASRVIARMDSSPAPAPAAGASLARRAACSVISCSYSAMSDGPGPIW